MGVWHTSVRVAAAASLCVGALLTVSAPALAAPSDDDTILPAEQKIVPAGSRRPRDTTVKPASDLQDLLDSISQSLNDNVGRTVRHAVAPRQQNVTSQVATSIATPIANGAASVRFRP